MNSLENNIKTMGMLSKIAYNKEVDDNGNHIDYYSKGVIIKVNNEKYKVIDYADTISGLQALLLKNETTNSYVIAFRGTQGVMDVLTDISLVGNFNPQYNDARNFVENMIKEHKIDKSNLTLTGHSLGGILTQQVGASLGIKGYAYNPWGASALTKYPPNGLANIMAKILEAVGIYSPSAEAFAKNNIYNISYQDEGLINGDILSNLLTGSISKHLGNFIPIVGKNAGVLDGHFINTLNNAIKDYSNIVEKFDSSCRFEDLTNTYLTTAMIYKSGYDRVNSEFSKMGVKNANKNSLHLNLLTPNSSITSIFSSSKLSTPALYALVNLNPFIVSGINSNAYDDIEKFKDEYSSEYIKDKVKMFESALDSKKNLGIYFSDIETGITIDQTTDFNGYFDEYHFGTNSNDIIRVKDSKSGDNKIYALAGDDSIIASNGNNYIEAGSGNDIINLSSLSKYSKNIVYGDTKDSKSDDENGNDIIIGGKGQDSMFGGSGFDSYYAGDKDIITDDSDGKGKVIFNSTTLTGGTYDKEKSCYVSGDIEYHLNGNTLIVKQGKDSLTINNFNKDLRKTKGYDYLGIDLLDQDEISVSISDNSSAEGNTPNQSMDFTISVNGEIPKGEFAIINVGGKEYLLGNPSSENIKKYNLDISKYEKSLTHTHTWSGNETPNEDIEFEVSGSIVLTSDGLKVKDIISGKGVIIDDDNDDEDVEDIDPIIIDLNRNGITSSTLNNTTYFDHDNNSFKEASSWLDSGDAFLALDKNGNGTIDNGNELFGNQTIANTKFNKHPNSKATHGFEALKAYDQNNDNVIDDKDEIYDKLLLWKDDNKNATTDKGELIKLKDSGITSIDLNYKEINIDESGNTIKQTSKVTFEDGSTAIANDVWFKVNLNKTKEKTLDEMISDTLKDINTTSNSIEILSGEIESLKGIPENSSDETLKSIEIKDPKWGYNKNGIWDGYIPDCEYNFDEDGFDIGKDGEMTGWRAFSYYPFLGTFWPTNGSTDDTLIRLPEIFQFDENGKIDREIYKLNLLIVESLIKQKSLKIDPVDESKFGVDLNQNGKFDVADEIKFKWEKPKLDTKSGKLSGFSMSYVGLAKNLQIKNKVQIAPGLYPLGTEFLHSVRYIDINGEKITPAKRMKELRYGVKKYWQSYGELLDTGAKAIKEKRDFPDRIEKFIGNVETGLNNNRGWFFQGFIEDKKGDLRPQNYEESVFCMGCHSNIGALTDSTFVFARKFEKGAYKNGWYYGGKRGFEGIKDFVLPNGKGEYALYLYLNNAGDEFRSNDEIMQKFFVSNWRENKDMIKKECGLNQKDGNNIFVTESLKFKNKAINILKNDISYLIIPSPKRAMRLNKTYKTIVDEQSFVFGRDGGVFENVHKSVKEWQKTGIKAIKF